MRGRGAVREADTAGTGSKLWLGGRCEELGGGNADEFEHGANAIVPLFGQDHLVHCDVQCHLLEEG